MRPSVRRLEAVYHGRIDFHVLNIDQRSTNALAERFRVSVIPTIILLDAEGELVQALLGYQTEEALVAAVEALLAAAAERPSP